MHAETTSICKSIIIIKKSNFCFEGRLHENLPLEISGGNNNAKEIQIKNFMKTPCQKTCLVALLSLTVFDFLSNNT